MTHGLQLSEILYELQPITRDQIIFLVTHLWRFLVSIPSIFELFHHVTKLLKQIPVKSCVLFLLWAILWRCSAFANLASLYFMASCVLVMYFNLGERGAGELSAYSVFNAGFARLVGTMTAEQLDREMRHEAPDRGEVPHIPLVNDARREAKRSGGGARRSNKKQRRNYEQREMKRQAQRLELQDEDSGWSS